MGKTYYETKYVGGHRYSTRGTSDCAFGCGCWMGPVRSNGPEGIDPSGSCPKNSNTKPDLKPFHESIVEACEAADEESQYQCLSDLLGTTKLLGNYDRVIEEVRKWGDPYEVIPVLELQKREAEEAAAKE